MKYFFLFFMFLIINAKAQQALFLNNNQSLCIPSASGASTAGTAPVNQNKNDAAYSDNAISVTTGYGWTSDNSGFNIPAGRKTNSPRYYFSEAAVPGSLIAYGTNAGNDTAVKVITMPAKASADEITAAASFKCGTPLIDARDGKSYNTTLIGSQCWMAENLNYSSHDEYVSGVTEQSNNRSVEKYCYFDNAVNCKTYGALYQWAEMVQYINGAGNTSSWYSKPSGNIQGVCPAGWHIPTDGEWCTMENSIEAGADPDCSLTGWRGNSTGGMLKQADTLLWRAPNTGGINAIGFSALPGGGRFAGGAFNYIDNFGFWWTATEANDACARYHAMSYNKDQTARNVYSKSYGFHVRCVKD